MAVSSIYLLMELWIVLKFFCLFVFNFKTLLFKKQTQYHPPYPYPKSIRGHARITISKTDSSNKHRITALLKCWRVWLKHKPYYVLESQSPRSSFPGSKKITASISTNKQQSVSLALTCLGLLAAPTSREWCYQGASMEQQYTNLLVRTASTATSVRGTRCPMWISCPLTEKVAPSSSDCYKYSSYKHSRFRFCMNICVLFSWRNI